MVGCDILRGCDVQRVVIEIDLDRIAGLRQYARSTAVSRLRNDGNNLCTEIEIELERYINLAIESFTVDIPQGFRSSTDNRDAIQIVRQSLGKADDDLVGLFTDTDKTRCYRNIVAIV